MQEAKKLTTKDLDIRDKEINGHLDKQIHHDRRTDKKGYLVISSQTRSCILLLKQRKCFYNSLCLFKFMLNT